jgi:hypothetical protein
MVVASVNNQGDLNASLKTRFTGAYSDESEPPIRQSEPLKSG